MAKRKITVLPPLDVVAMVFPGEWFVRVDFPSLVWRIVRTKDGFEMQVRRFGEQDWQSAPESIFNFAREIQRENPDYFQFYEPVEVEDEEND